MADKYQNFRELRTAERLNADYRIRRCAGSVPVAVVAPHGGKIEKGTSEIATAIAGDAYSLYCFEAIKPSDNWDLHLTSTRFDEPKCLELISICDLVVTVHGCKGPNQMIYVGGLDEALRNAIDERLEGVGFTTDIYPNLKALSPDNICNRGRRGKGVQLEISNGLRKVLLQTNSEEGLRKMSAFANAVSSAIDETLG